MHAVHQNESHLHCYLGGNVCKGLQLPAWRWFCIYYHLHANVDGNKCQDTYTIINADTLKRHLLKWKFNDSAVCLYDFGLETGGLPLANISFSYVHFDRKLHPQPLHSVCDHANACGHGRQRVSVNVWRRRVCVCVCIIRGKDWQLPTCCSFDTWMCWLPPACESIALFGCR